MDIDLKTRSESDYWAIMEQEKTSVLEGIAVALGGLFVNVAGVSTKNIVKDDVRMSIKPIGDSSTAIEYYEPVLAGCTLHITEEQNLRGTESRKKYLPPIPRLTIRTCVYG